MRALVFDPPLIRWPIARLAGRFAPTALAGPLGGIRLRDISPPPLPGPDWVRLTPRLGGICGSDLALITLRNHPATFLQRFCSFPAVLGHENVATIAEIGSQVAGWRVGQRVCADPALGCIARGITPPCPDCAVERPSLCENVDRGRLPPGMIIGLNAATGGSWSGSFVAHASQLVAVPDSVPDGVAVLVDPIACATHAVLRRPPQDAERVLVTGGGVMALGVVAAIRAIGYAGPVTAIVRHDHQAELMRRFGATDVRVHPRRWSAAERYDDIAKACGGRRVAARFGNQTLVGGFDLTYECLGSGPSLGDGLKWTRARGTLVAVGTTQINVVDTTAQWFKELHVVGCNGRQVETYAGRRLHTYALVFEWLQQGRLRLDGLLTHRFPLGDYRAALATLLSRGRSGVIKAAFVPE